MKPWMDKALISVIGLTVMFIMAMSAKEQILSGKNDFAPLYNGTQLLGSPFLPHFQFDVLHPDLPAAFSVFIHRG